MPLARVCPGCDRIHDGRTGARCPTCQRADDRRRNRNRKTSGRTTAAWQRLRLAVFHRDGHTCQRCGQVGTTATLTGHLDPRLGGNHHAAALGDITTLCRSCHGTVDAPRSHAEQTKRTERVEPAEPHIVSIG